MRHSVCRAYVEQTLSSSFRSHTAVTPHDWQTYEEMRRLALDKYGLCIDAIDVPKQAWDQSKPPGLATTSVLQDTAGTHVRSC